MSRRPVRKRNPLPGNEVEVETVTAAAIRQLEDLDRHIGGDYIMESLTDPNRPGLFSPTLDSYLSDLAQKSIDVVGLIRRLARLCGDKRYEHALPEAGVTHVEREVREACEGMTDEETTEVRWAAVCAQREILERRKVQAGLPAYCPKCGGTTNECELDGGGRRSRAKGAPPARRCYNCNTVTPNVYPVAKVLTLVKPELPN